MFSILNQGSTIYILDKSNKPEYKVGEVMAVSQPKTNFSPNFMNNSSTVDLKIKIDDEVKEFNSIPSAANMVSYNNGKIVLSETKQNIQNEVEVLLQNSKNIVDNIDTYRSNITECENILKQLNPQFAKDKERDSRLDLLEDKLDRIYELIKK